MCSSRVEQIAVFADTNLGTRMAVSVSPSTSVRDFKRELELEHMKCFPDWGEIRVCGLMVKRKSFFYHLPESMPIKHAQGRKGTWFLHMEAKTLNGMDTEAVSKSMDTEVENHTSNGINGPDKSCLSKPVVAEDGKCDSNGTIFCKSPEIKQLITNNEQNKQGDEEKKQKEEKNQSLKHLMSKDGWGFHDRNEVTVDLISNEKSGQFASKTKSFDPLVEASSERSSEIVSITGIIKRYFPSSVHESRDRSSPSSDATIQSKQEDQIKCKPVDSCSPVNNNGSCTQPKANRTPRATTLSSPLLNNQNAKTCMGRLERVDVGKRLLVAANSVRRKKRLLGSLQDFKDERLQGNKPSSTVRPIAFDISDSE